MSHFIEKCVCGITLSQCRCPDPNKTVKIKKPCTHDNFTTGELPECMNCKRQFIGLDAELCPRCRTNEPKRYKAIYTVPNSDPFAAGNKVEVQGYYVKHVTATPNPINTPEGYRNFVREHTKHYIITDGFSDWNMPREMEIREIDITTLKEVEDEPVS